MGQPNAVQIVGIGAAREGRECLYKADYPRRIDWYLDFFGTGTARRGTTADRSSELVLESLV
jgi:hypothetical protein